MLPYRFLFLFLFLLNEQRERRGSILMLITNCLFTSAKAESLPTQRPWPHIRTIYQLLLIVSNFIFILCLLWRRNKPVILEVSSQTLFPDMPGI